MQLEIDGIGQQKMTLSKWKATNDIHTHNSPHMDEPRLYWTCWGEIKDPAEFLGKYGDHAFGFGGSEKTAILDFCKKHDIEPPFWWSK
tara:strand:+ start:452 stop:715 length:264 start_codon:yes stop_codon:yes gene_type:complete